MKDAELHHEREILQEAFAAGWQAALAVNITNPRVLAVIESCFELWLEDALDEAEVLGLTFRRRHDLPGPSWRPTSSLAGPASSKRSPSGAETSGLRFAGYVVDPDLDGGAKM